MHTRNGRRRPLTRVRAALLWHMHQPAYRDPLDGSVALPWVRLHALKDYLGMLRLVEAVPEARATFNLVPCLVDQVEAYAAGASDPWRDVSLKPAASLTPAERCFALRALFMAHHRNLIGRFPRFVELLAARGSGDDPASLDRAALRFSSADILDLQVLGTLCWFDLDWQREDPVTAALVAKGRGFSEDDKAALFDRERALLGSVLPAYRSAAESGRVELCTSPYYHPILPLLCDTEAHLEAHPGAPLPRRFRHPEDAADQIRRALDRHAAVFGRPASGMWPSEGSVSEDAVCEIARAGLRWTASDEAVLERGARQSLVRDVQGLVRPLELLYRPWRRRTAAGDIRLLFRDRVLSDLIGFAYASSDPSHAAEDLLGRLRGIGRAWSDQGLAGDPVVGIILDGENAWEHYADGGRIFLKTLYEGLAASPDLTSVTMSEAVDFVSAPELPRIFAGSWINADFSVWIGHTDDRRAWDLLGDARDALTAAGDRAAPEAWEAYRAACGSDWCWWYGEDHFTDNDLEFDRLFRSNLQAVYFRLGLEAPAALEETLISARRAAVRHIHPTGLVTPVLDGEVTTPGEWAAAGLHRAASEDAAMHRGPGLVEAIRFGAGGGSLHLLVETREAAIAALEKCAIVVAFPATALRYRVESRQGRVGLVCEERDGGGWIPRASAARAAAASVLEIEVPLAELPPASDHCFEFRIAAVQGQVEVERHPMAAPLRICLEPARG